MPHPSDSEVHPLATWHRLEADGLSLRYLAVEGVSKDTWIVFHGFGQKPSDFMEGALELARIGRVLVVELPAHGQSNAPGNGIPVSLHVWEHWLLALCRKERVHTCSLFGYSLGGRLALASALVLKGRVEQLVLCAAEGASRAFWYTVATQTVLGRALLVRMVYQPGWVLGTLGFLARLGLLNKSVARFAGSQLGTKTQRRLVARSWMALRALPGSRADVVEVLNRNAIPLRVFAGTHDRVVPLSRMEDLAEAVEQSRTDLLPVGHQHLPLAAIRRLVQEELDAPGEAVD